MLSPLRNSSTLGGGMPPVTVHVRATSTSAVRRSTPDCIGVVLSAAAASPSASCTELTFSAAARHVVHCKFRLLLLAVLRITVLPTLTVTTRQRFHIGQGTLTGNRTFPVICNHRHAAPITGSPRNRFWCLRDCQSTRRCGYHPHSGLVATPLTCNIDCVTTTRKTS